jgi:hypothetical protein
MKATDAKRFIGKRVDYAKRGGFLRTGVVVGTSGRNIQLETDWLWAPDVEWMRLAPSEVVSEQKCDSRK